MVHSKVTPGQCQAGSKVCSLKTQNEGYRTVSVDPTSIAMEISQLFPWHLLVFLFLLEW